MTIFDVNIEGKYYSLKDLSKLFLPDRKENIFLITDFPIKYYVLDLVRPEETFNQILSDVEEIEKCCPVGMYFGKKGTGEGVVCRFLGPVDKDDDPFYNSPTHAFKIKGDEHQVSRSSAKTRKMPVGSGEIDQFVADNTPLPRLEQGLDYLQEFNHPIDKSSIPIFLKWVVNDIHKEEYETIAEKEFDIPTLNKKIYFRAVTFFLSEIKKRSEE